MEWTADGLGWARLKDPSQKKLGARWGSYAITSQETNIAMGNGPFIEVYLLKMVIFHGYVKLPDGTEYISGWWCNNHLEKYEFVNGKDDIPYIYIYILWKIKVMFQTTNQECTGFIYKSVLFRKFDMSRTPT